MSTPDFNNMTAAQIKEFIEGQPTEVEQPEVAEQPRDEQGRFVSTQEPNEGTAEEPNEQPVEESTEEPQQFFHREEIDNGQGGKEVFTGIGPTPEEAVQDCLRQVVEAKGHATRKIRELTQTPVQTAPVVEEPIDETDLMIKLQSSPSTAIKEIVDRELAKERKAREEAEAARKAAEAAAEKASLDFVAATPDFYACDANGKKMIKWMEINGRQGTLQDMQDAYADLKDNGLLVARPEPAAPRVAKSSGLTVRNRVAPPPKPAPDLSKLTKEQLLELSGGYQNIY